MTQAVAAPKAGPERHDREIFALALPAFGALVAEPLFVMADSAIVGHLGTPQLAGLGIAAAVLTTAVSVFVFLAYATTAAVSRRVGAGDLQAAIRQGIDGIWLALLLGAAVVAVVLPATPSLVSLFGASDTVAPYAITYLRISALGIPAMLMVLAATGVIRGLQDTRTPLYVAIGGFALNAGLNVALVYGAGLGIAGSAWGTVIAQCAMAAAYLVVVVRGARRHGASLRPDSAGIRACAQAGAPLLVRTLSLRAILMIATAVAARLGDADIAAHQILLSLWSLLAFALDAIAIAGQAIIGRYLGAGDTDGARAVCRRMVQWGIASGVVLGLLVVLARPVFIPLFTSDPAVEAALLPALLVVALSQPVSGIVFVLDGVLMGAGDGRYLARAMLLTLAAFAPAALLVPILGGGLTALWWAMTLMMVVRMITLRLRAGSGRWLIAGATR
ncbi:MATE family efflux transporter [Streptomyces nojiriensis]|uniref:MATE family efflux transporter n=1 Tax=Streptomyces nojiriensis TaxID=66374 RepID=A0ABQ3SY34_9ACTN|nr:MATE family efflux transporter [Streptomyces nojiriensis]QTI46532.1 DNA damage-inducible protein F [Streptomyces nojiriensis]GGR99365.1 MATE family efflux transporter [Streptomyces nojiriensis]GHI73012.1 MATE family efflux transporter [Streptomyces nojiriensis]